MDTSAAWNRTISTKLMQRNDACPACFARCPGEKSNVVISPTLSLSPTSSSFRKRTTFSHCESARTVSKVYIVNGAVFVLRSCEVKPSSVAFPSLCLLRACGLCTSRVVSCPFSFLLSRLVCSLPLCLFISTICTESYPSGVSRFVSE